MIWRDVLVEQRVDDVDVARSFAAIFGVAPSDVVVSDLPVAPGTDTEGRRILVERRRLHGDAALHLCVFLIDRWDDPDLAAREMELLRGLAAFLKSPILSDDGVDPSRFLRILPSSDVQPVLIDDARLDEEGYVAVLGPASVESRAG